MLDCPICGRTAPQDTQYCVRCGSRLAADVSAVGRLVGERNSNCPACQHASDAEFCAVCGGRLGRAAALGTQEAQGVCARCGHSVLAAAKFCSVCGTRPTRTIGRASSPKWSSGAKLALGGGLCALLIFISASLLVTVGMLGPTSPPQARRTVIEPSAPNTRPRSASTGAGTINVGWYCALTKDAFEDLTQSAVGRDSNAIGRLALSGQIVGLEKGTRVRILGGIFSLQIRVEDGPAEGTVCYVPTEYVTK
jgi:hypothetical protein